MKIHSISVACAAGVLFCATGLALAQTTAPSTSTLQAGDNAQTQTPAPGSASVKKTLHRKRSHKEFREHGKSATPGLSRTPTPGATGAPVSASGSGS